MSRQKIEESEKEERKRQKEKKNQDDITDAGPKSIVENIVAANPPVLNHAMITRGRKSVIEYLYLCFGERACRKQTSKIGEEKDMKGKEIKRQRNRKGTREGEGERETETKTQMEGHTQNMNEQCISQARASSFTLLPIITTTTSMKQQKETI